MLGNAPQHCWPQLQIHERHLAFGSLKCLRWSNLGTCSKMNKLCVTRFYIFRVVFVDAETGLIAWLIDIFLNCPAYSDLLIQKQLKSKFHLLTPRFSLPSVDSCLAHEENSCFYKAHYHIHKRQPLGFILSQINLIHIFTNIFSMIQFHDILIRRPKSSKWFLPLRCFNQNYETNRPTDRPTN